MKQKRVISLLNQKQLNEEVEEEVEEKEVLCLPGLCLTSFFPLGSIRDYTLPHC